MIEIFIMLIAGHFICDYVFQTDAIATGKNRLLDPCKFGVNWYYWMTSHAITHGVAVGLITNSVLIGVIETILHWIIDTGKCEKHYGLHVDQALHVLCKILYVMLFI